MRLRGGEDEHHVGGGLFQGLQKRVERFRSEHVNFVDDVDFPLARRARVQDVLAEVPHLVDTTVRGAVDFQHIQAAPFRDFDARSALVTRFRRGPVVAIHGFRQDTGHRRFANATRPGEQVRIRQTSGANGIRQGRGDVLLSHDLFEPHRSPFPGKNYVRHSDPRGKVKPSVPVRRRDLQREPEACLQHHTFHTTNTRCALPDPPFGRTPNPNGSQEKAGRMIASGGPDTKKAAVHPPSIPHFPSAVPACGSEQGNPRHTDGALTAATFRS